MEHRAQTRGCREAGGAGQARTGGVDGAVRRRNAPCGMHTGAYELDAPPLRPLSADPGFQCNVLASGSWLQPLGLSLRNSSLCAPESNVAPSTAAACTRQVSSSGTAAPIPAHVLVMTDPTTKYLSSCTVEASSHATHTSAPPTTVDAKPGWHSHSRSVMVAHGVDVCCPSPHARHASHGQGPASALKRPSSQTWQIDPDSGTSGCWAVGVPGAWPGARGGRWRMGVARQIMGGRGGRGGSRGRRGAGRGATLSVQATAGAPAWGCASRVTLENADERCVVRQRGVARPAVPRQFVRGMIVDAPDWRGQSPLPSGLPHFNEEDRHAQPGGHTHAHGFIRYTVAHAFTAANAAAAVAAAADDCDLCVHGWLCNAAPSRR